MAKIRISANEATEAAGNKVNVSKKKTEFEEPTAQVMLRMTPSQKDGMTRTAKDKGLTNAAYIKSLLAADGAFE